MHMLKTTFTDSKVGFFKGPSINNVGNWEGEGVKNWSKLPTDSAKKTVDMGEGGCQKSGKIADVVYGWSLRLILLSRYHN